MAELPELPAPELPTLPTLPIEGASPLGVIFPPTWLVIHNGNPVDKEVAEKIVDYLMTKMPPVIAMAREILPDADPDPMDLLAHGIIIVGGPAAWWPSASHWHLKYLEAMNPGWENKGTPETPIWMIVQKNETIYETDNIMSAVISNVMGAFPWLTVWNVVGYTDAATVQAGELFCAGEMKGIWIDKQKVANT